MDGHTHTNWRMKGLVRCLIKGPRFDPLWAHWILGVGIHSELWVPSIFIWWKLTTNHHRFALLGNLRVVKTCIPTEDWDTHYHNHKHKKNLLCSSIPFYNRNTACFTTSPSRRPNNIRYITRDFISELFSEILKGRFQKDLLRKDFQIFREIASTLCTISELYNTFSERKTLQEIVVMFS